MTKGGSCAGFRDAFDFVIPAKRPGTGRGARAGIQKPRPSMLPRPMLPWLPESNFQLRASSSQLRASSFRSLLRLPRSRPPAARPAGTLRFSVRRRARELACGSNNPRFTAGIPAMLGIAESASPGAPATSSSFQLLSSIFQNHLATSIGSQRYTSPTVYTLPVAVALPTSRLTRR